MNIYIPSIEECKKYRYVLDVYEGIPADAVRGKRGTQTSFKPGNDNSKAVAAARKVTLGRPQSEEHIARRARSKMRRVCVDGIIYNSGKEAAIALNISPSGISNRIKRGVSAWLIS